MRIWWSLIVVLLCATSVAAQDLSNNPAGVPWLNTNDEWGRAWGDAANQFYKNLEAHQKVHGGDRMPLIDGTAPMTDAIIEISSTACLYSVK